MVEQISQIWDYILIKWHELDNYLLSNGISINVLLLVLVLIVAVLMLLRYLSRIRKRETFSLLLSKGEIRQGNDFDPMLSLRVSNLNAFPVQILELSIDSEEMTMPIVVETAELIAANDAISIELELNQNIVGDTGDVYLFAYLAKRANKLYRLKASYSFEPWAGRYKISPLKQQIKRVRLLDSQKLNKSLKEPLNAKYLERSSSQIQAIETPKQVEASIVDNFKSSDRLSHTEILNSTPKPQSRPSQTNKRILKPVNTQPKLENQEVLNSETSPETQLRPRKSKTVLKFPNEF